MLTHNKAGTLFLGGREVNPQEKKRLQNEAAFFQRSLLWKVMTSTLVEHSYQKMFRKSMSFDDLYFGKAMLYNVDVQEKILKKVVDTKKTGMV